MAKLTHPLAIFDPERLLKRSRLSVGTLEARGVPAILLGVAAIVLARGMGSALLKSASMLPESLRETRQLWIAVRAQREMLT